MLNMEETKSLHRTLGIPMLTFYGTGMILGAGIYTIIGKAAGMSGETLWLSFLLAGFAALLTAFSYAELSSMFPKAGAEYVYLSHAFKKEWLAASAGVAMAFSGAATAAAVSLAFAGYLSQFADVPPSLAATALLVIFTSVSIMGIRESAWTNVVFTLIEMSGLVFVIYVGLQSEKFGDALSAGPHMGTVSGAALIVFSYFGFENLVNLADETKKPAQKIPRAILLSLGISMLLYFLVSLAATALISSEELAQSQAPLLTAVQKYSVKAANLLGAVALFSTANTALISLVGASRILFGMSRGNTLPQFVSHVHKSRRTPWKASLIILAVSFVILALTDIETAARISSFATMAVFLGVNISLISLRFTNQSAKRPFRVPWSVGKVPILPVMASIFSLVFLVFSLIGLIFFREKL
jgi:basic amino acid/polyamine antiporter, APA family